MSHTSRIRALEKMLDRRPDDPRLKFGLAVEYLEEERTEEGIALLRSYLEEADDEGNGWGRLGAVLLAEGRVEEARKAYRKGVEQAHAHGHPTMAAELEATLRDLEEA